MAKFFTAVPVAFYDPEVGPVPEEAVAITDAEWLSLIDAQSKGKVIKADAKGFPVAVDPAPPSVDQLLESCKLQAKANLADTDWAELPSVSNPARSPYLKNVDDFLSYREILRGLVVSPVVDPVWPDKPVAAWSK